MFNLTYLPCRFSKYVNDTVVYNNNNNNNNNNNDNNNKDNNDNTDNKKLVMVI